MSHKNTTLDIQHSSIRIQSTDSHVLGVAEYIGRVAPQNVQYGGIDTAAFETDGERDDSGTLGSRQKNRALYVDVHPRGYG